MKEHMSDDIQNPIKIKISKIICLLLLSLVHFEHKLNTQVDHIVSKIEKIERSKVEGLQKIYITLKNSSDSAICILHSSFLFERDSVVQYLPVYRQTKNREFYALWWDEFNSDASVEALKYNGFVLLPGIKKEIVVEVQVLKKLDKYLLFEYIIIADYSYEKLKNEKMNNAWYAKYHRNKKEIHLVQSTGGL